MNTENLLMGGKKEGKLPFKSSVVTAYVDNLSKLYALHTVNLLKVYLHTVIIVALNL